MIIILKVKEILDEVGSTSGRNDKELILLKHKDNPLLQEVLKFMYCDLITTGISKKKLRKFVKPLKEYKEINFMEYLKENNTGSDRDIQIVQQFINNQDEKLQDFYRALATKNMKLGFTKSTLNKLYKGENDEPFIEDFKVMLASKYQDHEDKVKDFLISVKMDGIRCLLEKDNGKITLRTRQGKTMVGLAQVESDAMNLPDNLALDGELVLKNPNNLNSADLFRETMKVVRKDGVKKNVEFHVFDMLPLNEFRKGKSTLKTRARKKEIEKLIVDFDYIKAVPTLYDGNDKEQVQYWLTKMEEAGNEGVMINDSNGYYEAKRSRKLLKCKTFFTVDLEIIGFEEGNNKYENMLGKVIVLYKGSPLKVGSGFSDAEREKIWLNQDKYLGRICEVSYFEESTNQKDDSLSLRFGTWKGLRENGKEVSYN